MPSLRGVCYVMCGSSKDMYENIMFRNYKNMRTCQIIGSSLRLLIFSHCSLFPLAVCQKMISCHADLVSLRVHTLKKYKLAQEDKYKDVGHRIGVPTS